MKTRMSLAEGVALHGLLEEATNDIVVRVNQQGFIETASSNIADIGYDLSQLLFKPHLVDLADPDHAHALRGHVERVLSGCANDCGAVDWLEFPIEHGQRVDNWGLSGPQPWYALSLRALSDNDGGTTGAMGLLRSVERKRALEGEIHARSLIDPLTGLANRHAFCAALRRHLSTGAEGAVVMFEIDRLRAVFMQYGQRTADEIVWGFAKFLETMTGEDHKLAQFDGERFCVILKGLSTKASRHWAQEVLVTFASLTLAVSSKAPRLLANAGLTPMQGSVDATLRQAELALVMARARGGMQVAECAAPASAYRVAL